MSDLHSELVDSISNLPLPDNYTPKDRYSDFRKVFMGSEEGKRVYNQLLSWGKLFNTSIQGPPIDPYHLAVVEGQRNFATKLLAAVNIEPPEQKTKARRKK